jgi:hypothetical protein
MTRYLLGITFILVGCVVFAQGSGEEEGRAASGAAFDDDDSGV